MNKPLGKQNLKQNYIASMLISLIGVILCLIVGLPPVLKELHLQSAGQTVTGTVTYIQGGGKGRPSIGYTYHVDGVFYAAVEDVRQGFARTQGVGETLTITYLPSDPKVSCIEDAEATTGYFWLACGALYAAFGMFASFKYWKKRAVSS
jgi:hypothetical protein